MTSKAAWICAVLLLCGCASKSAQHRGPSPAPPPLSARIHFALAGTPRSLDVVPVTVRVDKDGRPVTGAHVFVDLSMPSMPMPGNTAALRETAPGTYTGTVRFSMSGAWTATVTAAKGSAKGTQTFPVTVQ